jgi:hypothetical protein
VDLLVGKIRKKRELSSLDEETVRHYIRQCFFINPKLEKALRLKNPRTAIKSREFNDVVKFARASLREVYGVFIMDGFEKKNIEMSDDALLRLHRSSSERIASYPLLYQAVFSAIPSAHRVKIVDLGCGINPASYQYITKVAKVTPRFIATEISSDDVSFLNSYFKDRRLDGVAVRLDLTKEDDYALLDLSKREGETLVCFLWKLIDTFEATKRHTSKRLISFLSKKADILVITFPEKSIGGRKTIGENKRWWLENFLENAHLKFEKSIVGDEIVYVVQCNEK